MSFHSFVVETGSNECLDDYQCVVQVSDNGNSDLYSWYSCWEQVEALVNICVRAGQIGIAEGLGEFCVSDH